MVENWNLVQYGSLNQTNKNIRPIGKKFSILAKKQKKSWFWWNILGLRGGGGGGGEVWGGQVRGEVRLG